MTLHKYFTATECPGKYLESKIPYIVKEVNKRLSAKSTASSTTGFKSYVVTITATTLNVRAGAGTNYKINTTVKKGEKYTIVEEKTVSGNKWGKLKSGAGWISLAHTKK